MHIKTLLAITLLLLCVTPKLFAQTDAPSEKPYPGYTRYSDENRPEPREEEGYRARYLLDGWGAIGVGIAEPLYFRPRVWISDCSEGEPLRKSIVLFPLCGFAGVVEGTFLTVFDVTLGFADILTGGYWRFSKKAGVFSYFEEETADVVLVAD